MNMQRVFFQRFFTACFASFLIIGSLFIGGGYAQADTLGDFFNRAGKEFLTSAINHYTDDTEAVFNKQTKAVQQTIKELSSQLDKINNPNLKASERTQLLNKIAATHKELQNSAGVFNRLADQTKDYDNQLEGAIQDLLGYAQNEVRGKLDNNRNAFTEMAKAITAIANDTDRVDGADLADLVGRVSGNVKALNGAFDVANKALKAFSA